ncbi:MAG TPA: carboxypeptidase-like regulatory domain-containing protein [Thermoanaerobaculia bacterium]|nr:carboxypeptidase-like regulatory domain-containing protein [Thermoanaerobaculia bacterium]
MVIGLALLISTVIPADGDLAGCTAVVAEARVACGERVRLGPGVHATWIERRAQITPFLTGVEGGKAAIIDGPLVAAGEIRAPEPVRIFDVETRAGFRTAFERRVTGHSAMPAGRAVAAVTDARGAIIGLSRPVVVTPGRTVTVSADVGSHVIAFLTRPRRPSADAPDEVTVALETVSATRAPDVFSDAGDRILAIWYDVEARHGRIVAASKTLSLEAIDVAPRPSRVADVRAGLVTLPSIDVVVVPPRREVSTPMHLSVARNNDNREIRRVTVVPGKTQRIESLPRDLYSVALLVGGGEMEQRADLTSGVDAALTFAPEPLIVSGVVRHGGDPVRATISFRLGRSRAEATTDDQGRYELTLWQPRMYEVLVTRAESEGVSPFKDFVSVLRDMTYDVEVPGTDVRVRVTDARTGEPIAAANVGILNAWGGEGARASHQQTQNVTTDDAGTARFAPLRPGKATLYVAAEGYFGAKAQELTVADGMRAVIEIRLDPQGEARRITLLLPDNTPAAGAEVFIQPSWSATAAANGSVEIPHVLDGSVVLIRHANAASAVRRFDLQGDTWQLGVAAPPLRLGVERWSGWPEPATVTIWLDGVPISGAALRWLTRASASLPSQGDWVAFHLPAAPLRIIAQRGTLDPGVQAALAASIPYPWPAGAIIRVTD